jgi:curved DNA-binding protein
MNDIAFDDYYEDLQISPNADVDTIERVYRLLAKRYHPDKQKTGDQVKFGIISKAHRVLSNPEDRAAYDVSYEGKKIHQWQILSKISSPEEYKEDLYSRRCLLSILYIKCRENPSNPSVGLWHLEKMLGWPENVIQFHFWYLKEKDYIRRDENGQLAITVTGVDKIEQDGLVLGKDRLLPESTEENNRLKLISDDVAD